MKKKLFQNIPVLCVVLGCLIIAGHAVAADVPLPVKKPLAQAEKHQFEDAVVSVDGETLKAGGVDEYYDLPDYPMGARLSVGANKVYTIREEDTLLDIARAYGIGFVEMRAANPKVDPWSPIPGQQVVIPSFHLLPRAEQDGILVNLGDMRLYYFSEPGAVPETYPLGIGREGLATPVGKTTIVRKKDGPSWYPTERMRTENPNLPAVVPPGASNPLGTHALYLGWPTFLIHGTNKPWGVGRRVSSGCMRMYPEDIKELFKKIHVGTKVTVVEQHILLAWLEDGLYLEAHPSKSQSYELEMQGSMSKKEVTQAMRDMVTEAAGDAVERIDWDMVEKALRERSGMPVLVAPLHGSTGSRYDRQDAFSNLN